jgi:hypothetical protein
MSPSSEPAAAGSVREALGPDRMDQIELYEADLKRHEEALIDLGRTETAIRGFAITAVAALVAAAYASGEQALGWVAFVTGLYFGFLDYYCSRLDAELRGRIKFLSRLAQSYRRVLAGGVNRRRLSLLRLESDLGSFDPFGTMPSKPVLWMGYRNWRDKRVWRQRQALAKAEGISSESVFKPTKAPALGPIRQFWFLYLILTVISVGTAVVGGPGGRETALVCAPAKSRCVVGPAPPAVTPLSIPSGRDSK